MTELEINKALALAIGHSKTHVNVLGETPQVWVQTVPNLAWMLRVFDYRDWNVIGPIAERYGCFPLKVFGSAGADWSCKWACGTYVAVYADTPQKAIAMAVIGAKK